MIMPDRVFVATVTYTTGVVITTTVYGPNPTAAEARAAADPKIARVVVRSELPRR